MRRCGIGLVALAMLACGGPGVGPGPGAVLDPVEGGIGVFAAASLTAAFNDAGAVFQVAHPRAAVHFNFAGSAGLAAQVNEGAPADVFASADLPNVQKVVTAGNSLGSPRIFATNKLQIVVRAGNPKGVKGLADLAAPGTVVVLCAPAVPCGAYAGQALDRAGVKVTPRSLEQDVNGVVSKVALGEADAGIVYVTDVKAAGTRVQGIDIPSDQNVVATYPVVAVKGGTNPRGGQWFIDFLLGTKGQAILARHGFGSP